MLEQSPSAIMGRGLGHTARGVDRALLVRRVARFLGREGRPQLGFDGARR
jgi:hypothetical protein